MSALASSGVTPVMRYDALGRLIRTDFPNGTFSKVVFDPWKQESWDPNDTVLDSLWYATNHALSSGNPMRRAADLTEAHAGTPTLAHGDSLGRTFLTQADNGTSSSHVYYDTKMTLDVEGNTLEVIDARGNTTLAHTYCPMGTAIETVSAEAGASQALYDVAGVSIRSWNSRDVAVRRTFDALRRPTHLYVKIGNATEFLAERTLYGEGLSDSTTPNLRGRVYRVYDSAGVVTHVEHDFKGNLLETNRVLAKTYASTPDWSSIASITNYATIESTAASDLESETFTQTQAFDALNRVTSTTLPDATEVLPTYNEANLLEAVDVKIRGSSTTTAFVRNVDYNARGQRTLIEYAGASSAAFSTTYSYDAMTFRLSNQTTTRASDSAVLQDFSPIYDPVGNIVELVDDADQSLYFTDTSAPALVANAGQYTYDPIYRLISATGREHPGQGPVADSEVSAATIPHPNDSSAMRAYVESYSYDEVGNILEIDHDCSGTTYDWTRTNTYASTNNRPVTQSDPTGKEGLDPNSLTPPQLKVLNDVLRQLPPEAQAAAKLALSVGGPALAGLAHQKGFLESLKTTGNFLAYEYVTHVVEPSARTFLGESAANAPSTEDVERGRTQARTSYAGQAIGIYAQPACAESIAASSCLAEPATCAWWPVASVSSTCLFVTNTATQYSW